MSFLLLLSNKVCSNYISSADHFLIDLFFLTQLTFRPQQRDKHLEQGGNMCS